MLFIYNCSDSLRASIRSLLLPFREAFFPILTARQLFQRSQAVLSVIHRLDVVHIQLFGQLAGIDPVTLTAISRGIFSDLNCAPALSTFASRALRDTPT